MKHILIIIFLLWGVSYPSRAQKLDKNNDHLKQADSFYFYRDYKNAATQYNLAAGINRKHTAFKNDTIDIYKAASANAHAGYLANAFLYLNRLVIKDNIINSNALPADSNFFALHKDKLWQQLLILTITNRNAIVNKYGKAVTRELVDIHLQRLRRQKRIDSLIVIYGPGSALIHEENILDKKANLLDFTKVRSIINAYGWLGPDIIGVEANQYMFEVIVDTDFNTAKKYIPLVWQAFVKGDATADNYAALADKVALIESGRQIYGSIVKRKDNSWYVPQIIEEHEVNSRRAKIGLPPLAEYLKQYGLDYVKP